VKSLRGVFLLLLLATLHSLSFGQTAKMVYERVKEAKHGRGRVLRSVEFDNQIPRITEHRDLTDLSVSASFLASRGNKVFHLLREAPAGLKSPATGGYVLSEFTEGELSEPVHCDEITSLSNSFYLSNFAVSPSGEKIAFVAKKKARLVVNQREVRDTTIYEYDSRTTRLTRIAPFGYVYRNPVYSPKGDLIAFYRAPFEIYDGFAEGLANDNLGYVLCVVSREDGNVEALSPPPNSDVVDIPHLPAWSPSGKHILFVAQYNEPEREWPNLVGSSVHKVSLADGGMKRLTPAEPKKFASSPSWAPDGKRFSCVIRGELIVFDAEGGLLGKPLGTSRITTQCKWSPTEDLIAYIEVIGPNQLHLGAVASDGSRSVELATDLRTTDRFEWLK
jgi:Tol biopolymer transport system component